MSRAESVSSMRNTNVPPVCRAYAQLNSAVRTMPDVRVARRGRAEPDADVGVAGAGGQVDGREDIEGLRHDAQILPASHAAPPRRTPAREGSGEPGGRRLCGPGASGSADRLTSVPRPATVTVTSSPAASGPTPAGVPVRITSPGSSVITADTAATRAGTEWMSVAVEAPCT